MVLVFLYHVPQSLLCAVKSALPMVRSLDLGEMKDAKGHRDKAVSKHETKCYSRTLGLCPMIQDSILERMAPSATEKPEQPGD